MRLATRVEILGYEKKNLKVGFEGVEIAVMCLCSLHSLAFYKMIPIIITKDGGALLICMLIVYGIVTLHTGE